MMLTFSGICRSANRILSGFSPRRTSVTMGALAAVIVLATTARAQPLHAYGAGAWIEPDSQTLIEFDAISGLGAGNPFVEFGGSTWVEHIAGGGPGWDPYTALGGSIPVPFGNGVLMIEGQGLLTNDGNGAGSVGIHRRFFVGRSLFGVGVWYDVTQSPNQNTFHQTSASLEWFPSGHWTVRGNGYLPVGTRTENLATIPSMSGPVVGFRQNNLISSTVVATRIDDAAMRGYDLEVARNIGTWAGEAFIGYYNYEGDVGGSTDGLRAGARGYITPRLAGSITVSDDADFGTNVYGGITWFFGGRGAKAPRSLCDKLTIPVERNPQIVINEARTALIDSEVLTSDGVPITITHVRSQGGGSNLGTWENPFTSLPATQSTDIVYVHANSTFDVQSYILNPGQSFLGEGDGNTHSILTDQLGSVTLPAGNGGANRPVIQNTPIGVQVADGSLVSNVRIANTISGIFADSVAATVDVDRTIIEDSQAAILIDNSAAQFTFTDVSVTDATLAGLSVNGGSANVDFGPNSTISQTTDGVAAQFIGGHTGTINFLSGSTVNATSGLGLGFVDADGQYNFDGDVTLNGGNARIAIIGDSDGTFTFGPGTSVTVSDLNNTAFAINNLGSMAQVDFGGTISGVTGGGNLVFIDTTAAGSVVNFNDTGTNTLSGDGAGGIVVRSAAGDVTFTPTVSIQNFADQNVTNAVGLTGGSAVYVDDSTGTVTFADLNIDMAPLDGVAVGTVFGNPGIVNINGGAVSNTGGNGVTAVNAGGFNLNNTTFTNTAGDTIELMGSTVSGAGNVTVPATAFSSNDGGGNAGTILFNGGADSAP